MRVVTGTARGARLKEPGSMEVRPTIDRVKEAMFNIIQFDIEGRNVLDLFAGTGQLAIEALSRGAEKAVLVDIGREAVALIRENLKRTKLMDRARIIQKDYCAFLSENTEKFDLIFLDPPYQTNFLENALQKIAEFDILTDGGIIISEQPQEKEFPLHLLQAFQAKKHRYGKTAITVFTKLPEV